MRRDKRRLDERVIHRMIRYLRKKSGKMCPPRSLEKTILNTAIHLWEYPGEHAVHAKIYLIDDRMTIVICC